MKEKLLEKIRALFRLADKARGASPAEAELAMEKALLLMTKHGIDKIEVEQKGAEAKEARSFNVNQYYFRTGRQRHADDAFIATILRECFNVRIIWSSYNEVVDGWYENPWTKEKEPRKRIKERLTYIIVGEPEDIEVAKIVIEELHSIMWHLYRAYLKDEGLPHKNFVFQSYFNGIQDGFIKAAERGKQQAMNAASPNSANQYAIVLVDKAQAIRAYVKAHIPTKPSSSRKGGKADFCPGSYERGVKDGGTIRVGLRKLS